MNVSPSHTEGHKKEELPAGFTLSNVMTIQIGKWYMLWGLAVIISFLGAKILLGDAFRLIRSPYAIILVIAVFYVGIRLIQKRYLKKNIRLSIDRHTVKIAYDNTEEYSGPVSDFKAIRTLHPSNGKGDVQAELFFRGKKISLTSAVNQDGKQQFDTFCSYCRNKLSFEEKDLPFSIWTHNWQGVKYVEYQNPDYRE
ncbi:hypothetical protein [Sinomicrobium weinanense]|uniref:Uncharacterized protein n=1 Tax=Sinomicrobium weinanense TaxID=2842200 RepID=A0A926Q497_9FLAO|nr:hypothetical protein [Sinomicrobium weinanense]MBC9797724.1 hypothetical protein [Sinomicrobium weinanense]MBU3123615.1 hypothetical protein [Sinomicrobium weinanense]